MLSKARIKFVKSLQIKKYRKQEQCFIVQGAKSVQELLRSDFETLFVAGTGEFLESLPGQDVERTEVIETTERELASLGEWQTNEAGLAVARMKENIPFNRPEGSVTLVLDDIRDPGNLGTIIRSADWFGINQIIASPETADFYNPKVVSATMGSFTRSRFYYVPLDEMLATATERVYGAYLDGRNVHGESFREGGLILIGNESRGISERLARFVTDKITIPRYGKAESLNAAIATAIICDNVCRSRSN